MSWRLRSISLCLRGSRLCIGFVNLFLSLSALILASLAFVLTTYDCIPIPKWALSHFSEKFQSQGLELSWNHISADLAGGIAIEELKLIDPESNSPIFTSDFLYADFDLWAALRGNPFALDSIFLQGGAFFPHPQLSLSGSEDPLIRLESVHFEIKPHSVQLAPSFLQIGSNLLTFNGSVPFHLQPNLSPQAASFHWQKQWITLTEQINSLQSLLTSAPQTNLHLQFTIGPQQSLFTSGSLSSPKIKLPHGITLLNTLVDVPSFELKNFPFSLPQNITFSIASAQTAPIDGKPLSLFDIQGKLTGNPFSLNEQFTLPESLTLRIANLNYDDLHADTFSSLIELPSLLNEPRFSIITQFEDLLIQSKAQLQPKTSTAVLDLSIQGNINSLFTIPSLHLEALADQTHFSSDLTLEGTLKFKTGYTFESADLHLTARQFSTRETLYDELYSPIKITPVQLYFGPIAVYDPHHQSVQGYYIQDLKTLDYRILAQGNIFPRRINSLLPPFYTALWESIDPGIIPDAKTPIEVPPVHADVDVHCRWHTPLAHAFFSIQGQNIAYNGQPTEDVFLRVWQANGFVDLLDLQVSTSSGALNGNIAWIYPQKPEDPSAITQLQLQSTLPLPLLGTVFGPEIAELSTAFELDSAPTLSIQGVLTSRTDGFQEKDLHIHASVDSPLIAYQVPLDHLDIHADLTHDILDLHDVTLGLHQGILTGNAKLVLGAKEERPISLNLTIKDAIYSTSLKTLEHLLSETSSPQSIQFEEPNGKLNLQLNARGNMGQWESFIGTGSIQIQEAQLAKIHLFGGLSKVFDEIKLPITSFHLNRLESNIILHPGQLYFYDLVVAGPAGRIESPGTIYIPKGSIEFNAKVFFLGSDESGTFGDFFGTLISPLAHAFELKLRGTLSDPKWTFKNNPFQLLNPFWKTDSLPSTTTQKIKKEPTNSPSENE